MNGLFGFNSKCKQLIRFGTVVYFHTINVYSWFNLNWACEHTHFLSHVINCFDRKFCLQGWLGLKNSWARTAVWLFSLTAINWLFQAVSLPSLYSQHAKGIRLHFLKPSLMYTGCLITSYYPLFVLANSWHHCCETRLVSFWLDTGGFMWLWSHVSPYMCFQKMWGCLTGEWVSFVVGIRCIIKLHTPFFWESNNVRVCVACEWLHTACLLSVLQLLSNNVQECWIVHTNIPSIMAYSSTPYVGMSPKKWWPH